jgi:hypothetical protein
MLDQAWRCHVRQLMSASRPSLSSSEFAPRFQGSPNPQKLYPRQPEYLESNGSQDTDQQDSAEYKTSGLTASSDRVGAARGGTSRSVCQYRTCSPSLAVVHFLPQRYMKHILRSISSRVRWLTYWVTRSTRRRFFESVQGAQQGEEGNQGHSYPGKPQHSLQHRTQYLQVCFLGYDRYYSRFSSEKGAK